VEIDPKDKALIDTVLEIEKKERDHRGWRFWLFVAALSVVLVYFATFDVLPGLARIVLAAMGGIGALLFVCFLFAKPFGRDFYNGPGWWL
jgi:uncharacterized membrane protein